MKKKLFKSLQTDLMVFFLGLVILSIGIFITVTGIYSEKMLTDSTEETNQQLIDQVGLNVENYIDHVDKLLEMGVNQEILQRYLDLPQRFAFEDGTQLLLVSFLESRNDLYSVAVLDENGKCLLAAPNSNLNPYAHLEEKRWFKKIQQSDREIVTSTHVQNLIEGQYKWVITIGKKIPNADGQDTNRIMIIDLNYEVISDLCRAVDFGQKGYVYILDENGRLLYHPQQQLVLSDVKSELVQPAMEATGPVYHTDEDGNEKLYTSYRSSKTGWTVVGVSYVSEILQENRANRIFFYGVSSLIIIIAVVLSVVFSRMITKPIKNLQNVMQKVQKDDFEPILVKEEGRNEIADLCASYNRMITYIDELLAVNTQKVKEQQASEMKALQSQINPHFLYNTLDSIIWMIETDEQEQAIRMTSALAKFFRKAIGNSEVFITIEEELEYTRQYLTIQRMRYNDKLDFDIQVDSDIKAEPIIKLVLQPLVENALYHGLKYQKGKGSIRILGYRMGDNIWLKVCDNGIGIEPERLSHLFENSSGIGLSNVQGRIQLYYGKAYGLQVESERGIGTTVTVIIPAKGKG